MNKHISYKGFWTMLALMFGFTIFSASVMSGAGLAKEMATWKGAIAILMGNVILALYGATLAFISSKRKKNLDGVLKRAFGKNGAIIPSMVMIATQTGWFGVGIAMIAIPLGMYSNVSPWAYVFIFGGLIMLTAFFGIKSLTIISIVAVPLVLILGFIAIGMSVGLGTYKHHITGNTNFWVAISIVIGTFISGATFVPNFAVNAKSTKIAVSTTALAFLVGNGLMISFGFISQLFIADQVLGFVTITDAISNKITNGMFLITMGIIILILNIWTTNDSGLYSISLGLNHWIKMPIYSDGIIKWKEIPKRIWVVVFGLLGSAASIWLYTNFIVFLSYMNRFVPPIGALIMINYLFKNQETRFTWKECKLLEIFFMALSTGLTFIPLFTIYAPLVSFGFTVVLYLPYILLEEKYFPTKINIIEDKKDGA
ncbi:cytosine permease [Candidatus Mycoplasma mahonii]|uniref:cytosine permease n=1 Tax=Candidatus Mycoplasma mahonii TaxID=3004105 RepID=UPI0026EE764A|nr:cytosine permease [Candidatus Mycoplasma mahonii]WKX02747.1 cytosine permease [Candidatus Mycoplasma mahonii]